MCINNNVVVLYYCCAVLQVSVTFDPFSCLAVPLPKKMRLLSVVLMRKDPSITPVKVHMCVHTVAAPVL